jgi:hypothetical protein
MAAERFELVIESEPSDVPAILRLRQFLKAALRQYRLRCVSIKPATVQAVVGQAKEILK